MCRGHIALDVAPASSMAFPAASRQGALPRQDAGFVFVFSRCRCQAFLLPFFATERGAHVKIHVKIHPRQNADFGRSGICRYETCGNTAVRIRGSRARVLATLSRVSAFPEPLMLSPCVTHIRAEGH